jgi:hypothetical protein
MYNYTESEIEKNNNKSFNNNNKNNRKVFVKPIISSLNNLSYNNNLKSKKEKKSYVSNDNINNNLNLEANNKIPNKTDNNNNIIQTDSNVIKFNNVKYTRASEQPNIINNNLKIKENNVANNYISDKVESEDSYIPDNNIYNKNSLIKENDGISTDSYIQSNISKDDMLTNNNNNNINQNNKIYTNKEAINGLNSVNVNVNVNANENNKFEQAKTYISPKITFTQQEIEAIFNEGEKLRFSQEPISQIANTNTNNNNNSNQYSNIIAPESNNLKNINEYKNCMNTNYKIINKTESSKPVNETKIVSEKEFKYPENITFQNVIYQEEPKNYSNIISNQLNDNNTERALLTDKNPTINQYTNEYLETFPSKQEIKTIQPTTDYTNINQNNINYKINQTIINDNRTKPNNDIVYINKEVKKKNPNIMVIDNTKSINKINFVNDNNKETIINNANKNRNSQKNENIIQYKYTTPVVESQPRIYSPTKNYDSIIPSQTYVEYHGPKKVNETIVRYKTPIREPKKKEEIIKTPIITTQNINYYSPSIQEIKHTMVQSPTIIEKPIIQYNKVEQTIPITYSPAKYLPPIITYEESYDPNKTRQIKQVKQYKQYKQSRPIPKVQKMKYNPYSLDVPQKVTNYNVISVPSNTSYNTGTYIQQNISPYVYQTNEIITHKDPSAPILNLSYLNTIQDINKIYNNNSLRYSTSNHSSRGSRGSSVSVSKQKFDKFGNPIYASSLDNPSKRIIQNNRILHENTILKKNSLRNSFNNNNNINYSPFYYPRSLSQENFKGQKLRLDEFNNYNGTSSPYGTPVRTPRLNNNRNYGTPNLHVINPVNIVDSKNRNIINHYLNTDLSNFSTFSLDSFKYFYPNNENHFKVPNNEIYVQKEITKYMNNDPNTKQTYIGSVNHSGEKHGYGRLITPNSKIIGTWRKGRFTGWGRQILNNGEIFEGNFNNGKLNGKGIYKYRDILYVGDFENNKKQGKGEKITKDYYYKGDFNNNKIDGYGKIQFINNKDDISEYEGFFKENNIEGKGIMKWGNGNIYDGELKNGKMNGYGRFTPKNGITIEGYFKDGVKINKI